MKLSIFLGFWQGEGTPTPCRREPVPSIREHPFSARDRPIHDVWIAQSLPTHRFKAYFNTYNHQLCDLYFPFGPNVIVVHGDPGIRYHVPPPVPGYLGSSSQNNNVAKIVGYVIGTTVFILLLIGFAIFLCVKKKKAYHKMHPHTTIKQQGF
ncbi:hypothetical protein F2Q69_00008031 [Brassica cretica]|uniref:Uncharacterized protein n=1 Tax=Brassica cretica TaxID=69181 RepID=A0A8S9PA75_BRACR|nr:hypothetical protein F2Q69_00008031 [Brassica cretica]